MKHRTDRAPAFISKLEQMKERKGREYPDSYQGRIRNRPYIEYTAVRNHWA